MQALDLMHEPILNQKIKGSVSYRRLRSEPFVPQPVQDGIGSKRSMLLKQQVQDFTPDRRQSQSVFFASRLGRGQAGFNAVFMIVLLKPNESRVFGGRGSSLSCHVIPYHVCGS
jgi:hypothetical protein